MRGTPLLDAQAGMAYRDVPQSTYSHLMSSGAGASTRGEGKAKADARSLEELGACEAMMYLLPAGLRRTLLPFQRDGVLFGLRRKGRCIIADEMGTGKVWSEINTVFVFGGVLSRRATVVPGVGGRRAGEACEGFRPLFGVFLVLWRARRELCTFESSSQC